MYTIRQFLHARMALWLWVSLALAGLIALLAPQLLPVSAYKLSLITAAAWIGYWIDRGLFPYARPDALMDRPWSPGAPGIAPPQVAPELQVAFAAAMLRRAGIIAAAMIGVALGA